jgi:hypothetical protein
MWVVSSAPPNTPVASPSNSKMEAWEQHVMCPHFSGGDVARNDNVFPRMMGSMLDWMDEVAEDDDYANPEYVIQDIDWSAKDEEVQEGGEDEGIVTKGDGEDAIEIKAEMKDEAVEIKVED